VKFIFDISDGIPKILHRQDLSRLGWALGDRVREQIAQQLDGSMNAQTTP
jgi:hypothetical protein